MLLVHLQAHYPAYSRGYSMLLGYGDDGMYISAIFILPRALATVNQYRQSVTEMFSTFDVDKQYPLMRQHFDAYGSEQWLRGMPIEYFRNSATVTTNAEVARLATIDVVRSLFDKLEVHVHATNAFDRKQVK